ncbi:MAG TPA: hypothetical protein VEU33_07525, partial [Archangium sp.]|nr:hypothetical protein [Archangium sp.]
MADLHTTPRTLYASVSGWAEMGGVAFFANHTDGHGGELWRTDGTREGTRLVRDIFPGTGTSNLSNLVALDGRLFFKAQDYYGQYALWSSDGTPEGTLPLHPFGDSPRSLIPLGNTLLFMARQVGSPYAWGLWKSDGTAAGTLPVKLGLSMGTDYGVYSAPVRLGDRLLFVSLDAEHGQELWSTDGTPEGTGLMKDLRPGKADSNPTAFAQLGGMLLLWARSDSDNFDLWRTDGTAEGTVRIKDLHPGTGWGLSYNTRLIAAPDGSVFFMA